MRVIVLLLSIYLFLYANDPITKLSLKPQQNTQAHYFIKMATFLNQDYAKKTALKVDFPTNIVYMKKYFSLISQAYPSKMAAQKDISKIKKRFHDAYIITLYQTKTIQKVNNTKKIAPATPLIPSRDTYHKAVLSYNQKAYEDALALFDRVLIEDETNQDARVYYAKTLYQLGFLKESAKVFHVLEKATLKTQNKQAIKAYLHRIEKKEKRDFFTTTLTYGAGHDDNINLNTDKQTTQYGPFLLKNDTNKTKSTYGILALDLTHYHKGAYFDLLNRFYTYNELAHSAKGNDLNYLDLSTALIKKVHKFSFVVPLGYNRIYLDQKIVGYNFYTHPAMHYHITPKVDTTLSLSYTDNHTKYAPNRSYRLLGSGMGIRYHTKKVNTWAHLSYEKYTKKQKVRYDISKNVLNYTIGGEYQLLLSYALGANITYAQHHFSDLDPVMGYKRHDKQTLYALWLSKAIDQKTLLKARYTHTYNHANINLYSYHKNNYTLTYQHIF